MRFVFCHVFCCDFVQSNFIYIVQDYFIGTGAILQFDGLVQERRNSIANALELRLSCTNPLNYANASEATLKDMGRYVTHIYPLIPAMCMHHAWCINLGPFTKHNINNDSTCSMQKEM